MGNGIGSKEKQNKLNHERQDFPPNQMENKTTCNHNDLEYFYTKEIEISNKKKNSNIHR